MPKIPDETLLALKDELEKMAAIPGLESVRNVMRSRAAGIGTGAGVGALVGGVGGAGVGAVQNYRQAREQGSGRLGAVGMGALGALGKGISGMTTGLLAGGVAGGVAGGPGAKWVGNLTNAEGRLGGAARYGQRQVHGLTGWVPEGFGGDRVKALRSLRDPDFAAAKDAVKGLEQAGASKGLSKAQKRLSAMNELEQRDLTNLPGLVRGMVSSDRGANLKHLWNAASTPDKAISVGMVGLGAAGAIRKPQEGGPGRGEQIGSAMGGLAGIGQVALPSTAMGLAGAGLTTAGKYLGRGVDRLVRGRRTTAGMPASSTSPGMEPQPGDVSSGPVERQYSNAALGRPPEGMGV